MENNLKKLEQTIGYQFTAKSLLEQAMTHSSYANENTLESLDARAAGVSWRCGAELISSDSCTKNSGIIRKVS